MTRFRLLALAAIVAPAMLAAQSMAPAASANPVTDAAKGINGRYAKFLMASADMVPADKLGYKPTDAQMTFGDVWAHLVEANYGICAAIGGMSAASMPKVKGTDSKDALVAALKSSFEFCDKALAATNDSQMGATVDLGFMKGSRALATFIYLNDLADHYSQVANYMRLNGMLPPSAQKKAS